MFVWSIVLVLLGPDLHLSLEVSSDSAFPAVLRAASSEEDALNAWSAAVRADGPSAVAKLSDQDLAWLVKRGWFATARQIVTTAHGLSAAAREQQQVIATTVRRETAALKHNCDTLLQSLTVQKQVGRVSCAFQWAQNSSNVFLSIKFAHRWSSPGALELQNQKVGVTDCCFNFSADGEHSGLKKKYALDLHFYAEVAEKRFTWQLASAGRLTAILPKRLPGQWPTLLKAKEKPKNMAVWPEMNEKWSEELQTFKKLRKHLRGGNVPSFYLDMKDFELVDANADGLASREEMAEFAYDVAPALYADRDVFPYIKMWDTDKDGTLNATEWKGKGGLAESKLGATREMLLAQLHAADLDGDGLVSYEDLEKAGYTDKPSTGSAAKEAADAKEVDAKEATVAVDAKGAAVVDAEEATVAADAEEASVAATAATAPGDSA